ncbi:MAG: hypothetical protein PHY05_09725 [Methanothrix sp.]|nr:hypothetical protein [Methanothrix sp.]
MQFAFVPVGFSSGMPRAVKRAGDSGALNAGQDWILGGGKCDRIDSQSYVSSVLKAAVFFLVRFVGMNAMFEWLMGIIYSDLIREDKVGRMFVLRTGATYRDILPEVQEDLKKMETGHGKGS